MAFIIILDKKIKLTDSELEAVEETYGDIRPFLSKIFSRLFSRESRAINLLENDINKFGLARVDLSFINSEIEKSNSRFTKSHIDRAVSNLNRELNDLYKRTKMIETYLRRKRSRDVKLVTALETLISMAKQEIVKAQENLERF